VGTRPVSLSGQKENFNTRVGLLSPPSPLRVMEKVVTVFLDVVEEQTQRRFELPVIIENAPPGMLVVPPVVAVVLRGPPRALEAIKDGTLQAVVNALPEIDEGQRRFEKSIIVPAAQLPEKVQLVEPAPRVWLTMEKAKKRMKRD
jgi:hypothetical protein